MFISENKSEIEQENEALEIIESKRDNEMVVEEESDNFFE